jgi:hypothetical protein
VFNNIFSENHAVYEIMWKNIAYIYDDISSEFLLELDAFYTKVVENIKTHILYSIIFFSENLAIYEIM